MGQRTAGAWHDAWAGSPGIGMSATEILARVQNEARIAASHGDTFG